jgi:hypothetical protein
MKDSSQDHFGRLTGTRKRLSPPIPARRDGQSALAACCLTANADCSKWGADPRKFKFYDRSGDIYENKGQVETKNDCSGDIDENTVVTRFLRRSHDIIERKAVIQNLAIGH